MASSNLSRRAFLGLTGGAVLLAACGSSSKGSSSGGATTTTGAGLRSLRVSSDLYVTDAPQRFAYLFTEDDQPTSGKPSTIALRPQGGAWGETQTAVYHPDPMLPSKGIYTVPAVLTKPGIWEGRATYGGKPTQLFFEVGQQAVAPTPGQPAPRSPSPTPAAPLGVDPICTRDPQCPLHATSLDQVLGRGRPTAVMFATPARCQTRTCGPVLDQLLAVRDGYPGIDVVHVEIYKSLQGTQLVPTVEGWGLDSEPWLFTVDGAGVIRERLDGAFATDEIRAALDRIAA